MADHSSKCPLPPSVENLINIICNEQSQPPPELHARTELASLGEIVSLNILNQIRRTKITKSFTGFIIYKAKDYYHKAANNGGFSPGLQRLSSSPSTQLSRFPSFSSSQGSNSVSMSGMSLQSGSHSTSGSAISSQCGSDSLSVSRISLQCGSNSACCSTISPKSGNEDGRAGSQSRSPHFLVLQGFEFRKLFLILSYIGRNKLEDVTSVDEIQSLREQGEHLSMIAYESLIWNNLGQHFVGQAGRFKYRDWDPRRKSYYYHCHVYSDGSYAFKGPYLNSTTTLLQRVLKDENVLTVKFAEDEGESSRIDPFKEPHSEFRNIAEEGIFLGPRCYHFYAFKDGGKEMKKKDPMSSSVKCYFVNMESFSQFYKENLRSFGQLSVRAARSIFMHADNLSSLSAYTSRFALTLSKTVKLEVDLDDGVCIRDIGDIACKNEDGSLVYGDDGKLQIMTDGTGLISEDLAQRCPKNCFKGSSANDPNFERYLDTFKLVDESLERDLLRCRQSEAPLLIQFRMFHNGCAVKGTVLVSKQLPKKTIHIRPSMVKVKSDPQLFGAPTINSFEIVSTSNRPKKPHFSRFLIALLHFGGVPKQFFTDILEEAIADTENVLSNLRGALRVALIHGEMDDDCTVARMLLSGVPLEEPYIQWRLAILAREEKKSLKEGRLPIKESFYLMGTADPVGCLGEDEVCIIHENGQISGDVLVYRNPGIHFGDIRVLKATHQKPLEEIVGNAKYGIFFSTKGSRSLGDQMAGGDYDGDMYWISRNPELLRCFKPSEPWKCTYNLSSPTTKKPSEYADDELEYALFNMFLETRFRPSKSMGLAADSWLSYMDRLLTLGPESADEKNNVEKKMLQLVDIYYDALDAPKKGFKVEVPPELIPMKYPHYMGRGVGFSYISKSVLGDIFDRASELNLEEPLIQVWKLPHFEVDIPVARLQFWEDHYKTYRYEMKDAYSLDAESKKTFAGDLIQKYKQLLYGSDEFEKSSRSWDDIRLDALALYRVTYNYAIQTQQAKYCGFAWKVAGSALLKAFVDEQDEKPVTCLLSVLKQLLV